MPTPGSGCFSTRSGTPTPNYRDGAASGLEAPGRPPEESVSTFRQLDESARIRVVEDAITSTIQRNALGFLYATA
jgi:hypothetical protein